MTIKDIEAGEKVATPLTEEELDQAIEELREIVDTSDPDEDKLLHFGLLRLLATFDTLLAELKTAKEKLKEAEEWYERLHYRYLSLANWRALKCILEGGA